MRTSLSVLLVILAACDGDTAPANSPDASSGSDGPTATAEPRIPTPTGTCPAIVDGDVTFAPAGMPPRQVLLTLDDSAASDRGQLVIYWHATGSAPAEAAYSLGATEATITGAGGIIAVPHADPAAGVFEWFIVNNSPKLDDFVLADEIVACLAAAHRIDPRHVHSLGMSAGGLQTTALSFLRSSYIASVATFSGGMPDGFNPPNQNPDNKFAALIFDGGATDNIFGVDFEAASQRYQAVLSSAGHFAAICDHGNGHEIPLDAATSVATFFTANGFGAWPSPYVGGLPTDFPAYCAR